MKLCQDVVEEVLAEVVVEDLVADLVMAPAGNVYVLIVIIVRFMNEAFHAIIGNARNAVHL